MMLTNSQKNFGFPLLSLMIRMTFFLLLTLIIVVFVYNPIANWNHLIIILVLLDIILIFELVKFKKSFIQYRLHIQNKMISLVNLKGHEVILDMGAGACALSIAFAKHLQNGKVYCLDKYTSKNKNIFLSIIRFIKNNYVGHTLNNAKRNIKIENVQDKCVVQMHDFTKPLPFQNEYFDVITSFQSLHQTPLMKYANIFHEIDRLLKKDGNVIFFEPRHFLSWDIEMIREKFSKKGYKIEILPLKTRVIFNAKKLH